MVKRQALLSFFCVAVAAVLCCNTALAESTKSNTSAKKAYYIAESYDYSSAVPLSSAVSSSFFNKAAFLGDSRGVDLMLYSDISKTKALPYCSVGLNVSTVMTEKFINIKNKSYTAVEALKKNVKSIERVYLIFGLNELGYPTPDGFINQYEKLISAIRGIKPELKIYVMGVLPVSRQKDAADKTVNIKNICVMNDAIRKMCEKRKLFYIDAYNAFTDGEGYLPYGVATDGVHFSPAVCNSWFGYLKTHTVKENDK